MKLVNKALLVIGIICAILGANNLMTVSDSSLRSRVMKLTDGHGLCSGEQVRAPSGVDYVLTAAHCLGLQHNGSITVITEDGRSLERRVIAEDPMSDLLLLEGVPGIEGLRVASVGRPPLHVRTFTHGDRLDTYKTDGQLIQDRAISIPLSVISNADDRARCSMPKNSILMYPTPVGTFEVCLVALQETVTTALIVPGSSGGMVVDDGGDLVGVVSASDGRFGLLVRLVDIQTFLHSY